MDFTKKVFVGAVKSIDEKDMTLTAAISSDAVDRMGEVLDPNGVDLRNYRKNPVVLWAHDYTTPPIGKALWVKKDGNQVVAKVKFAETEFAQEIFGLFKDGFMNAFSVGFNPKEWEDGDQKKGIYRIFTKWELMEFSAVPVPANPEALSLAMTKGIIKNQQLIKSFETKDEELIQEFNNEVKDDIRPSDTKDIKEMEVQKELVNTEHQEIYEDLIGENTQLKSQVEELVKENSDLKYKLYVSLKKNQLSLSEITAATVAKEVGDEVRRVIRKAQGKID